MPVSSSVQSVAVGAVYGAIRCQPLPNWGTWPVWVHYSVVTADKRIHSSTMMVRPPDRWLWYQSAKINREAEDDTLFSGSVSAREAAEILNEAYGRISVLCRDLRPYVSKLYSTTGIARSWSCADMLASLSQFNIPIGRHAVICMKDIVPEDLPSLEEVEENARAYLDARRTHELLTDPG